MDAKEFIRAHRMRFLSLYPSDFAFMAHMCSSSNYEWKDGKIVSLDSPILEEKNQLTEAGWESFKHDDYIPYSWGSPHERSPIFNIPDDISKEWQDEISMFTFLLEKISEKEFRKYCVANLALKRYSKEATDSHIDRYTTGFNETKKLIARKEVRERLMAISQAEYQKKCPQPLRVMKGSEVRLKTGVSTAIVECDNLLFGNNRVTGACYLDRPLEGTRYWHSSDLTVVKNPA